jgi:hypothetical protein
MSTHRHAHHAPGHCDHAGQAGQAGHAGHAHHGTAAADPPPAVTAGTQVEWTCPMHPEIVRDAPGNCPICGMALEPRTATLADVENVHLKDMTRRFWVSVVSSRRRGRDGEMIWGGFACCGNESFFGDNPRHTALAVNSF